MNIVLIGFMGTGKTSAGRLVAEKLGWDFYDLDEMIEKDTKMKISEIFSKNGESYFRDVESKVVQMVSLFSNAVISCGGGVVLRQENMDALEKNGVIVTLSAKPEAIYERTKNDKDRPLLNVEDPVSKIKELLSLRESYYRRCSFSVETSSISTEQVADSILNNKAVASRTGAKL
jgi:shikimate kinase